MCPTYLMRLNAERVPSRVLHLDRTIGCSTAHSAKRGARHKLRLRHSGGSGFMDRMGGGGAYRQVISRVTGGNYIGVGEVSQVGWWGTSERQQLSIPDSPRLIAMTTGVSAMSARYSRGCSPVNDTSSDSQSSWGSGLWEMAVNVRRGSCVGEPGGTDQVRGQFVRAHSPKVPFSQQPRSPRRKL